MFSTNSSFFGNQTASTSNTEARQPTQFNQNTIVPMTVRMLKQQTILDQDTQAFIYMDQPVTLIKLIGRVCFHHADDTNPNKLSITITDDFDYVTILYFQKQHQYNLREQLHQNEQTEYYQTIIQPKVYNNKVHYLCIHLDLVNDHNTLSMFLTQVMCRNMANISRAQQSPDIIIQIQSKQAHQPLGQQVSKMGFKI